MAGFTQIEIFIRTRGLAVGLEIGVNFVLPFVIYSYCEPRLGDVRALLASSAPPVVWSVIEFLRHRRLDALSLLVLAGIVLSLIAFFGGGGARMLQLREKLATGVVGIAFLVSAAIGRPLIYELARAGFKRRGSAEAERMEALQNDRGFRRSMAIMTVVWGLGLIIDVAVGAALIFMLTVKEYLIFGPVVGYTVMGCLGAWTFWYSRRSRKCNEARRAAERASAVSPPEASPGVAR